MKRLLEWLQEIWAHYMQASAPWLVTTQVRWEMKNELFNLSEELMRDMKYPDLDEKVELFKQASRDNPVLADQLYRSKHPWKFAYEEGKRIHAQRRGVQP